MLLPVGYGGTFCQRIYELSMISAEKERPLGLPLVGQQPVKN